MGTLDGKNSEHYLLNVVFLDSTNHSTRSQALIDSFLLVLPQLPYDRFLLFITDGASYMKKAYNAVLKGMFPRLLHATCLAHALHNVADQVRRKFKLADQFVALSKKVFRKSPKHIRIFQSFAPTLSLPPRPTITRWGTWLEAVAYYAKNMEVLVEIFELLPNDSAAVVSVKDILQNQRPELEAQLACISVNYEFLVGALEKM